MKKEDIKPVDTSDQLDKISKIVWGVRDYYVTASDEDGLDPQEAIKAIKQLIQKERDESYTHGYRIGWEARDEGRPLEYETSIGWTAKAPKPLKTEFKESK